MRPLHLYTVALLFFINTLPVQASTSIKGTISTNTTWTVSGSPYIITGNTKVSKNITLTIEPGVVIKFDSTCNLTIDGTLVARGTPEERIVFTSNKFVPARGNWGSIIFNSNSTVYNFNTQAGCIMQYCDVSWGGKFSGFGDGVININYCGPFIDNCNITDNQGAAFRVNTTKTVTISNNFMTNGYASGSYYIADFYSTDSTAAFECNTIYNYTIGGGIICTRSAGKCRNNLLVNNTSTSGRLILITHGSNFTGNTMVDNTSIPATMILNAGDMSYNTFARNTTAPNPNLAGHNDSIASYTHNNFISHINNTTEPLFILSTSVTRKSVSSTPTNARFNWWGTTSPGYINSVIYDYNDDTTLLKIEYLPLLTSPDTIAPISPVTGVLKSSLGGGQVYIAWNPNPETDVVGYKVYYGNPTGYSYSNVIDVGNVTSYTLSGVNLQDTIAVTAYDHHALNNTKAQCEGNESWYTKAAFLPTGIEEVNNISLTAYPSPAGNDLHISCAPGIYRLTILNSLGQEISNQEGYDGNVTLDISSYPNGIYFIRVTDTNKGTANIKFIVQH